MEKNQLLTFLLNTFFKKNWPTHASFSFIFSLFKQKNTIFTTNQCEKMSKCPSSIQCWDSNPWPFQHESSPITTRPGLPPKTRAATYHPKSSFTTAAPGGNDSCCFCCQNSCHFFLNPSPPSSTSLAKCDQIWQNIATLAKFLKVLAILWGIFSYLAKYKTYFGKYCNAIRHMLILNLAKY